MTRRAFSRSLGCDLHHYINRSWTLTSTNSLTTNPRTTRQGDNALEFSKPDQLDPMPLGSCVLTTTWLGIRHLLSR